MRSRPYPRPYAGPSFPSPCAFSIYLPTTALSLHALSQTNKPSFRILQAAALATAEKRTALLMKKAKELQAAVEAGAIKVRGGRPI